ncbi:MAG: transporter ATP-binding protein [Tardiphaga sp.]|nr:transporter ATP-binding protein [Tardiphaga sp.]
MTGPLLEITGLSVRLRETRKPVVKCVDLSVGRGEIVCVVGESGSGKSVTAFTTMGLLPDALEVAGGSVLLNGEDLLSSSAARIRALRGRRMAMIFQEPMTALNPVLTVGRQIGEVLEWHEPQLTKQQVAGRVLESLREMNLPSPALLVDAYPHQMSGGQRQRVMIAMALVLQPDLLIADEPTTALDVTTQKQILVLIKSLVKVRNIGVLLITHDFGVVSEMADRVVVMQSGAVVESGPVAEVLSAPRHAYTRKLIDSVPRGGAVIRAPVESEIVLEVIGLGMTYAESGIFSKRRSTNALVDVSMELRRGEILGVVGESGSGKSTLARSIARLLKPTAGSINLHGVNIAQMGAGALRPHRRHVQVVFQDPFRSLNPRMKVGRALIEGAVNFGVSPDDAAKRVAELLAVVGMDESAIDRYPHEFSGGQRQRLCIARALASRPDILVADEAVSALDVSVQSQVVTLLGRLRDQLGLSIIFITHDLRLTSQICDRLLVMKSGEVIEQGPTAEIFGQPRQEYTKMLLASSPQFLNRSAIS